MKTAAGSQTTSWTPTTGVHTLIMIHLARRWEIFHRRFLIQALAAALPEGWAVLCVNRPLTAEVTPFRYPRRLIRELPRRRPQCLAPSLYVYTPCQPLHEIVAARVPGMTRLNRLFLHRQLRRVLKKMFPAVAQMISWIYDPRQHWIRGLSPTELLVYECYDDYGRNSNGSPRPDMQQREKRVLADADLAFFTADLLAQSRASNVRRACYLPNGAPTFLLEADKAKTIDRTASSEVRVGYLGNWYSFMATDLLYALCRDHPQWSFIFAGPVKLPATTANLRQLPNVTFQGPIPYGDISAFMRSLDVALIPFVLNEYVRATNPLKTYEYMATGVPVVASDLPELRRFSEIIRIAENTPQAFAAAIAETLESNRKTLAEKLIATAREYTWDTICRQVVVPELLRLVNESPGSKAGIHCHV